MIKFFCLFGVGFNFRGNEPRLLFSHLTFMTCDMASPLIHFYNEIHFCLYVKDWGGGGDHMAAEVLSHHHFWILISHGMFVFITDSENSYTLSCGVPVHSAKTPQKRNATTALPTCAGTGQACWACNVNESDLEGKLCCQILMWCKFRYPDEESS